MRYFLFISLVLTQACCLRVPLVRIGTCGEEKAQECLNK